MGFYESRAGDQTHESNGGFRTSYYGYQEGGLNAGAWYNWTNTLEGIFQIGKTATNIDPSFYSRQDQVLNPPRIGFNSELEITPGPEQKTIFHGYESAWYVSPSSSIYDFSLAQPVDSYGWLMHTVRINAGEWVNRYDCTTGANTAAANVGNTFARTVKDGGAGEGSPIPIGYFLINPPGISLPHWFTRETILDPNFGDEKTDDASNTFTAGEVTPTTDDYWVAWVEVTNGGSGYTSEPTVSAANDGDGIAAEYRALIDDAGAVIEIHPTNDAGVKYSSPPVITITGGGGSGAAATAHLSSEIDALVESENLFEAIPGNDGYLIQELPDSIGADYVSEFFESGANPATGEGYYIGNPLNYGDPRAVGTLYRELEFSGGTLHLYPARVVRYSGDALYTLEVDGSEDWTFADSPGAESLAIVAGSLWSTAIPTGFDPASETTFTLPTNGIIPKGTIVVPVLVVDIQDYYDIQNALKAAPALHLPFEVPSPRYTVPVGKTGVIGP